MGGACTRHEENEKLIEKFSRKPQTKTPHGKDWARGY
jgi:hypothetical protein